jgi:superfamily I DNA and RNA helicase
MVILAGITNKEGWEKIGYRVSQGQFTPGSQITLTRPIENSPNPIPRISSAAPLRFSAELNPDSEKAALLASVQADLKEGIAPDRILVLVPHAQDGFRRLAELATHLKAGGVPVYKAASSQPGYFVEPRGTRPDTFRWLGHLTVSFPTRAKGNEVDLVYLTSLHLLESEESQIKARNQIFTSMTRAKGWCRLSGAFKSSTGLAEEIRICVERATSGPEPEFSFIYRRPPREIDDGESQTELSF